MATAQFLNAATSNAFATTLDGNVALGDTSILLTAVTGLQAPGILCIDRTNGSTSTPNQREYIFYSGISTRTLTGVIRGLAGSTAQPHNSGALVEENMSIDHWNDLIASLTVEHNSAGTHKETALDSMITGTEAQGDIIYHNGTIWTRLPKGTDSNVLTQASSVPSWAAQSSTPAGVILPYGAATAPTGYLLCDGATVSQTTYATLYALIGHTYGTDPGSGNFILPNLKGKVVVGFNSAETEFDALAETGGEKTHALTTDELATHTHTQNSHAHSIPVNSTGSGGSVYPVIGAAVDTIAQNYGTAAATAVNQNTGSETAHQNLQPYITLQYIIKT